MTLDVLLISIYLLITLGIIATGYNIVKGTDERDLGQFLTCVFFWPLMLALALLIGCFFAVLVWLKILWFALNYFFGINTGRR